MKKIKDSMVVGVLGGLIGVICMDISGLLLWRNKKTEGLYGHLASSMIMNRFRVNKGKNFLVGQIFHMATASAMGVGMVEILKKYGKDHRNIKGGFLGVAAWGVLYNFGQRMGFYRINPRLIKSSYAAILHHLIYGLVTSNVIVALADPTIFPNKNANQRLQATTREENPRQSCQPVYSEVNPNKEDCTFV